jgi:O-antigen/teichoic acid export membrane protein
MGFSNILLQFSAHEFAHLAFSKNKRLIGDQKNLERLGTLWRFSMKWSISMTLVVFPFILAAGYFILSSRETSVNWIIPWIIYGIASIFVFINSTVLSFIEGCNSVGDAQKIRFHISLITVSTTLLLLISRADLYALAISLLIGAASGTMIITYRYGIMLHQLHDIANNISHDWKEEIMPLMWRYAVSWISGYFIFSIFTPIAFHYYGAVEAGKVGLSIAVCTAIFSIANIWMTTIIPKINILVAHKNYKELNPLFRRHLIFSVLSYIIGITILFLMITLFKNLVPFANRVISPFALTMIATGWLLQIIINGFAIYMRAHKKEPLVLISFIISVYITIATLTISMHLPFEYFFLGFLSSYLLAMPWIVTIFKKHIKRNPIS